MGEPVSPKPNPMKFFKFCSLITLIFLLQCTSPPPKMELQVLQASLSPLPEANGPTHPLDALTEEEIRAVKHILEKANNIDSLSRFSIIHLKEAPKEEILAWNTGDPIQRKAFAIVKQGKQIFEAVVDLSEENVVSWTEKEGVQPAYLFEEYAFAAMACKEHPDFQEAMRKRGYTSFDKIDPQPLSPGYFNIPEEEDLRLFKMSFHGSRRNRQPSIWASDRGGICNSRLR